MNNPGLKWLINKYYKKAKDATIFGVPLEKLTKEELMSAVVQANEALEKERKRKMKLIESQSKYEGVFIVFLRIVLIGLIMLGLLVWRLR
ncbi:MAG: hypothetical protein ACTSRC_21880 [Candidatus Helarchaeota archaeon]